MLLRTTLFHFHDTPKLVMAVLEYVDPDQDDPSEIEITIDGEQRYRGAKIFDVEVKYRGSVVDMGYALDCELCRAAKDLFENADPSELKDETL